MNTATSSMRAPTSAPIIGGPSSPTRGQVAVELNAACAAVGRVGLGAPVWNRLTPLVHELALSLDGMPGPWPAEPVVACRRLAVAVRRWTTRKGAPRGEAELVVALAQCIQDAVAAPAA
jgi:hypothetical protein